MTKYCVSLMYVHASKVSKRISKPKAAWLTDVIKLMVKQRNDGFNSTRQLIHSYVTGRKQYVTIESDSLSLRKALIEALDNICKYSCRHGLKINPSKTKLIHFGNIYGSNLNICVDGVRIEPCDTVNSLGIIIDKNLRFHEQIKHPQL
nr:unnamed protein product [Callosobruchus analis]